MEILFTPKFIKDFKSLEKSLQEEVAEKIELFKDRANHNALKVHKLKGLLKGRYSFSVNYQYRIIFNFRTSQEAVLYRGGNHDIYK